MPPKSQQRQQCEEITSNFTPSHPCAQWFSAIERSVIELSRQVENVALDVKELTSKVISQAALLTLIKEEYFPQIKAVPEEIEDAIHKHKKDCLASTKALKRAESSDNGNSNGNQKESINPSKKGFSIPKIVIYIGVVVGTAIAVGGYVLAYLFEKLQ
jgi:hypothetical protein